MKGESDRIREVYEGYERSGKSAKWADDRAIHAERAVILGQVVRSAFPERSLAGLRVLDLGCGRGELRADLISAGLRSEHLFGVDLRTDRLPEARALGLAVCAASGAALPFRAASFDLVLLFTVLSSVRDESILDDIGSELRRVLAPRGAVVVYDMRLPSPWNREVSPLGERRLDRLFPSWERHSISCTVLPPLARLIASNPGRIYQLLTRSSLLHSHLMSVLRPN